MTRAEERERRKAQTGMTMAQVKRLMLTHRISIRDLKQHPRLPIAPSTVDVWVTGKGGRIVPDAFARFIQEVADAGKDAPVSPDDIKDVVGMIGAAVDDMLNKDVVPRRWGFFITVVETGKDNPTMELFYNVHNDAVIMMLKEIVGRLEGRVQDAAGKA